MPRRRREAKGLPPMARSSSSPLSEQRAQTRRPPRPHRGRQIEIAAVDVAPAPRLAALEGGDQRVPRRLEVTKRVRVRRILAAADVAAGEAHAKLRPLRAE